VDSGSSVSILQVGVVSNQIQSTIRAPCGATVDVLPVRGEQQVSFHVGDASFSHSFLVCTLQTDASGVTGMDFLKPRHAILNLAGHRLTTYTEKTTELSAAPVARSKVSDHSLRILRESECGNAQSTPNTSLGTVLIMVANFSAESIVLPKFTIVGEAEEVSESLIVSINEDGDRANSSFKISKTREDKVSGNYKFRNYLDGNLAHLSKEDRAAMEPVLVRFANVFHDDETNDFKEYERRRTQDRNCRRTTHKETSLYDTVRT
jgi:hypothetical protein